MSIGVGIIGAGVMGADHARTIQRTVSGATLTAVCDLDVQRAKWTAKSAGARVFSNHTDLIHAPSVDAVLIASADQAHPDQVLQCIDAGKPVLCEKPLAPTIEQCRQIIESQQEHHGAALVSVGFMRRFHPGFTALKAQIRGGAMGQPLLVLGSHRNVRAYPDGGSEGTLTNSAVHDIDTTRWLLDDQIIEVGWYAPRSTSLDRSRQDPQLIQLRTANGVLASVDLFLNAQYGYDVRYEVVMEKGSLRLPSQAQLVSDSDRRHGYEHPADWRPFFADAYRLELQAWVDQLNGLPAAPLATAEDGLHAIAVATALIEAMHERQPRRVSYLPTSPRPVNHPHPS